MTAAVTIWTGWQRKRGGSRHRAGFSLVELLVVIAIIAILIAILLPVLNNAKERSKTVSCTNNARQMAFACHLYAAENNDKFCDTAVVQGDNVVRRAWFNLLFDYSIKTNVLLCPAFQWRPGAISAGIYPSAPADFAFLNYGFNFEVGGFDWAGIWPESLFPPAHSDAIRNPAQTVLLADSGTRPQNTSNSLICVTQQSPQKGGGFIIDDPAAAQGSLVTDPNNGDWCGPELRHNGGRSVVAMTDSHVDVLKASQWYWAGTPWLNPAMGGR
ncbi:MAG TPA: prepilin-type N-terminal cleavage/methylation domain-containing protein [Verrucomicrobiae bacterium]|nr:prepilin-type N-terminal cleavage/methylation domain-containing protein [Verrucomicrobiae bacterium]